jgi:hypothetical protein
VCSPGDNSSPVLVLLSTAAEIEHQGTASRGAEPETVQHMLAGAACLVSLMPMHPLASSSSTSLPARHVASDSGHYACGTKLVVWLNGFCLCPFMIRYASDSVQGFAADLPALNVQHHTLHSCKHSHSQQATVSQHELLCGIVLPAAAACQAPCAQ